MISILTQAAITLLHDISTGNNQQLETYSLSTEELAQVLCQLETKGLIYLLPDHKAGISSSYKLSRPLYELNLLEVLEALDEPVRFNCPTSEAFYEQHGSVAQQVGVLNHMARRLLSEIRLCDW